MVLHGLLFSFPNNPTMASTSTVLIEHINPQIVKITLNRPKVLNALNVDLLTNLVYALRSNQKAQIIILQGAGDRSFCAGEDLKQTLAPKTGTASELREAFELLQELTRLTSSSPAIVIAAVQGYAIGGGAEIALAADFVIGGPKTQFKFPEAIIGHAVTGGISVRLVQMVGLLKAKELFLLGKFTGAEEALKIGLLTEIADDPKLRALELAHTLAGMPAIAGAQSKLSLERAVFPNMENVLADEVNVAGYCFAQSDAAQAFTDFAARKSNVSMNSTLELVDLNMALSRAAQQFPERTFIRFAGVDLTFAEFNAAVAKLAGGFHELGVEEGDKVIVMMRNSVEMVHIWFATNSLGAVFVPINFELKSITLEHVLKAAAGKISIVDEEFYDSIKGTFVFEDSSIFVKGASLSRLYEAPPVTQSVKVHGNTVSAYLYTSGTTGRSKACILSHQYFITQAQNLIQPFSITSSDVLFCPFPLFHADATALTVVPALLVGCIAALSVRFSPRTFWDEIREIKATVYDFMGATLAMIYKQPPRPSDREHDVRMGWGVPIPSWAEDYEERFGHPIKTLYGSVEAGLPIVQQGPRVPGSCGTVTPRYELRIADAHDVALPWNTPGRLLLRATVPNSMFSGYFNNSDATIAAWGNLWMHTGDLAKIDEMGNVFFLGREKDLIRRRGENVNACEVEEELLRHPHVELAAATGVPSSLGDGTEEEIKVCIVKRQGSALTEYELWEWCKTEIARFQVPSVIEFVSELKKTPTGKVEKDLLSREGGVIFNHKSKKSFDLTRYKALSFDIYATLIDWEIGIYTALIQRLGPIPVLQILEGQNEKHRYLSLYTQYEQAIQSAQPTLLYPRVLAETYLAIAKELNLVGKIEDAESFGHTISTWPAFADTIAAMQILAKHYKLIALSNVDRKSLAETLAGPLQGLVHFDAIYTAEDIGTYKPDLNNFEYLINHVQRDFALEKDQILHVAQSLTHDHVPAKSMGMEPGVWIERGGADMGGQEGQDIATLEKRGSVLLGAGFKTLGKFAEAVELAFAEKK